MPCFWTDLLGVREDCSEDIPLLAGTNNAPTASGFLDPSGGVDSSDVYVAFYDDLGVCRMWGDYLDPFIPVPRRDDVTFATIRSGTTYFTSNAVGCDGGCCFDDITGCTVNIPPEFIETTLAVGEIEMNASVDAGVFYVPLALITGGLSMTAFVADLIVDTNLATGIPWRVAFSFCY